MKIIILGASMLLAGLSILPFNHYIGAFSTALGVLLILKNYSDEQNKEKRIEEEEFILTHNQWIICLDEGSPISAKGYLPESRHQKGKHISVRLGYSLHDLKYDIVDGDIHITYKKNTFPRHPAIELKVYIAARG